MRPSTKRIVSAIETSCSDLIKLDFSVSEEVSSFIRNIQQIKETAQKDKQESLVRVLDFACQTYEAQKDFEKNEQMFSLALSYAHDFLQSGLSKKSKREKVTAFFSEANMFIDPGEDISCDMSTTQTAELPEVFSNTHTLVDESAGRDAPERKQPAERENNYNAMLLSISDHMRMLDKDLNILWANDVAKNVFGDDIIGKKCYQVYHGRKEPCESYPCIALKAFSDGQVHKHDTQVVDKHGNVIYFHCTANVVMRDEEGVPVEVLEICRDITDCKWSEEKLQQSEKKYKSLFESASDALFILDVSEKNGAQFFDCNGRTLKLFGCTNRDQIIGKSLSDFSPLKQPDGQLSKEKIRNLAGAAIEGHPQRFEWLHHRLNGKKFFWVDVSLNTVKLDGKLFMYAVVKDITGRKKAEEVLRNEKLLNEEYIDSLPGLFCVFDEERFIQWNKQWGIVSGYSANELSKMYGTDFFDGSDKTLIADRMKKVFIEGAAEAEAELVTKQGKRVPYYFAGIRREFNGRPHLVGFGIDITKRKETEKELGQYLRHLEELVEERTKEIAKAKEFKEKIISTIPSAIVVLNRRLEISAVNRRFYEVFGIEKGNVVGLNLCEFIGCKRYLNQGECELTRNFEKLYKGNQKSISFEAPVELRVFDTPKILRFYLSRIVNEEEMLLVIEDITKAKMLESQLVQSEKLAAIGKLAAGIAHEINNPLQGIATHLDILERGFSENFEFYDNYKVVKENMAKIKDTVKHLLDIYRNTSEKKIAVNINDIINGVLLLLKNQIKIRNVNLELKLGEKLSKIRIWPKQIHQVILNLLLNAFDSVDEFGKVTISTTIDRQFVKIQIKDNGGGISKKDIKHVFEPFFSTKQNSGTGIGLFICKGIIADHNGEISVISKEGKGSVFTILLPKK